jgi:hypothetical protein
MTNRPHHKGICLLLQPLDAEQNIIRSDPVGAFYRILDVHPLEDPTLPHQAIDYHDFEALLNWSEGRQTEKSSSHQPDCEKSLVRAISPKYCILTEAQMWSNTSPS